MFIRRLFGLQSDSLLFILRHSQLGSPVCLFYGTITLQIYTILSPSFSLQLALSPGYRSDYL